MKIYISIVALFVGCCTTSLVAQSNKTIPAIYKESNAQELNRWVDSVYNKMTLDERIGQLFISVVAGDNTEANTDAIIKQVEKQKLGGLLFSKSTPVNHALLTNAAQKAANVPLLITLDGEWGLAMRLKGTTNFPRNMMLGAIQHDTLLYQYGKEVARQCRLMGIHVNFAPDMDVNSNPANPVIGYRSFGEDPERVARQGIMYSKGLEAGGVMAVSKHFPGHGDTSSDSHFTLPLITHDRARLDSVELRPFKEYIESGLSGIMVGHLNIPTLDELKQPSSLSKKVVTSLLQDELGFTGLIFTDGLQMKGVSGEDNYCVRALLAGNDVLLGPVNVVKEYKAVQDAVADGTISTTMIEEKCRKVLAYKYILGVHESKPVETQGLLTNLNTSESTWLNRQLNQHAITLLEDSGELIPLNKLDKRKIAVVSIGSTAANTFSSTLKKYDGVVSFTASDNASLLQLKTKLSAYNTIIFAIYTNKVKANSAIESLSKDKDVILTFFTSPYELSSYTSSVKKSDAVVLAYENTVLSQEFVAQAIFGGIDIDGRVPVSIEGLYKVGAGVSKKKNRLGYGVPEDVGIRSEFLHNIDSIARFGIKEKAYPGCQILVAKNGIVFYEKAFGTFEYGKDREVTTDDIYDLASMTKATSTVPAVMKLYDTKKLSLNDPLSKYIAVLKNTDKSAITVRDALFHETRLVSFIPYYMEAIDKSSYAGQLFNNRETSSYPAKFDANTWARTDYKYKANLVSTKPKEGFLPVAEDLYIHKSYKDTIISQIAKTSLRKRKSYLYSCLNFMLLKEAIESVAKMDLNSYVQDTYFHKLGSTTTTYNPLDLFEKEDIVPTERDAFLRRQLVRGYVHDEGAAFMGGISGNAGLFSNANDLAKLYQMLLNGGSYGGEQYLSSKTTTLFTATKSSLSRRGLGFDKPEPQTNKTNPTSISTPLSAYGHTGFTGTSFWIDPDNELIYIFLSNRVYPNRSNKQLTTLGIRSNIQEVVYTAIKESKNLEKADGNNQEKKEVIAEKAN